MNLMKKDSATTITSSDPSPSPCCLIRARSAPLQFYWLKGTMAMATTMALSITVATAFVSPVVHGPPFMYTTAAHNMQSPVHARSSTLANAAPPSSIASSSGTLTAEMARNRVSPRMGLTPEPKPVLTTRSASTRQRQRPRRSSETARQRRAVAKMYALSGLPHEMSSSSDDNFSLVENTNEARTSATKKRVQLKRTATSNDEATASRPARGTTTTATGPVTHGATKPRRRLVMKTPAQRSAALVAEKPAAVSHIAKPKGSTTSYSTEVTPTQQQFSHMESLADSKQPSTNEEWAAVAGKINMEALRQVLEPNVVPTKPVQFRGLSTTQYRGTRKNGTSSAGATGALSRSSTMPGFAAQSDKQLAYRDGVRLVERQNGVKLMDTAESRKRRKELAGVNMYRESASVPDSMIRFAGEIHQEGRISRKEEIELGEKTQEAIRLQLLYDNLEEKLDREPTDEEWCAAAGKINMEAIRQTMEEGLEAKNKLVTSNLRLVQSVVNTYIRNGLSAQYNAGDLMQEGIVALIRAAEKFEPQRGWKFSTYAMYWVRASVKRNQIYQSRVITIPQRLYETHKRLTHIQRDLETSLERKPTTEEIGAKAGMAPVQVERCLKAMDLKCSSIDQSIQNVLKPMSGTNRNDGLLELIQTKEKDDNELNFLREAIIETLNRHLNPEEVELLLLRYGLKETPGAIKIGRTPTIAELSLLVGLKPDKVRRTINKALKHLQTIETDEWREFARELC